MPATVRDILLVLRAKEEVTRTMDKVSGAMRSTQARAAAASARARAAASRAAAEYAKLTGASKAHVAALQAQAKAYDAQAKKIENSSRKSKQFATTLQDTGQMLQTAGISLIAFGAAGVYGMKQAIDVAADWDKQVRLTFTQVDKRYKPSLKELSDIGLRVSKDIAVPFETIQEALFDVFSSTEANMPQAEALLRSFAKAAVAGQTDVQTASRATIGLMNAFKVPFKDVNKLLDIQFQLVQEGVGTYEEWANRIGLVSPSAVRAGQSVEGMAAALSTATRLGMNAARASTSVARAYDAMSNPKTEKALKRIGVATRDAKGNFRPLVDVLTDWRKELDKLPPKERVAAILDVLKGAGGTIEARRFLQQVLLSKGGLELFQAQVKEFASDKGAFVNAYNDMAGSISAKTQLLHNAWMNLKLGLGEALMPTFLKFVGLVQRLVDWFNNLSPKTRQLLANFMLWGSVLSIVGGALLTVIGLFAGLAGVIAMAGTAILPIIGTIAAVVAIGTVLIGVLVAIGSALYKAYKTSEPFRAFIQSLASIFMALGGIVKNFVMTLWQTFTTNLLPALKEVWRVIQADLLPVLTEFANWFRSDVVPEVQKVATTVNNLLRPAFQWLSNVIKSELIPLIKDMINWWNQHQNIIRPVVKWLAIIGAALLGLAVGGPIASLIAAIVALIYILKALWATGKFVFNILKTVATTVINAIGAAFRWLAGIITTWKAGTLAAIATAIQYIAGIKGKVIGALSGAGRWLVGIGKDIVMGLVNGIMGAIPNARQAASNAAKATVSAAKAALGISSPSKVFRDIGMDTIRGLTEGIKASSTQKQLLNAMYKVARDIQRSIVDADISVGAKRATWAKWAPRLANTTRQLNALEVKRTAIQTKLAAAQKSVNDQIAARNDLAQKIKEAVMKSADITNLSDEEKVTTASMMKGLRERLQAVTQFQNDLRDLARRGFDKETIATLAQQGVETAGAMVHTIATGSQYDLQQINSLQNQIRAIAGKTGTNVAGDLYNAGIAAGQGLIKGLQSQIKGITKQMETIAAALVKAIKRELGIKSPSKVFDRIGVNTAQGYVNGYMARMNRKRTEMANASRFDPATPGRVGFGSQEQGMFNNTPSRVYNQHITVNTQEIDPRKQAADLGWELQGRLP